jgi:hypothetical protein
MRIVLGPLWCRTLAATAQQKQQQRALAAECHLVGDAALPATAAAVQLAARGICGHRDMMSYPASQRLLTKCYEE